MQDRAHSREDNVMNHTSKWIGVDISKAQLEVAVYPDSRCWTVAYTHRDIAKLIEKIKAISPKLILWRLQEGL